MRVCRIVDMFPVGKQILGGLGPNWYYLSRLSVDRGIDVHVICNRSEGQPEKENIEGIKIHRVSSSRGHRSSLYGEFAKKCLETILEVKPDLIHGHNTCHISVIAHRRRVNVPIITHLHGSVDLDLYKDELPFEFDFTRALRDRLYGKFTVWRKKYVAKHADLVIACSGYTANSVYKYFPKKSVKIVYNGVELARFKRVKTNLKDFYEANPLLLFVGRPDPWKGVQYILQAMPRLNDIYPDLKCIFVGVKSSEGYSATYYKWLQSIAEHLGLKNVFFLSPVPYFDLPKYYSAADCLIVPSYPDPSPKVVLEGQACSCPIVAANGGGIPEILGENSGLLFQPRSVVDLANKIDVVLKDPDRFKGGREAIKGKSTWEKSVDDMIECYNFLLKR